MGAAVDRGVAAARRGAGARVAGMRARAGRPRRLLHPQRRLLRARGHGVPPGRSGGCPRVPDAHRGRRAPHPRGVRRSRGDGVRSRPARALECHAHGRRGAGAGRAVGSWPGGRRGALRPRSGLPARGRPRGQLRRTGSGGSARAGGRPGRRARAARGPRRRRRGNPHLHVRHDRATQGRDAHAPEPQLQRRRRVHGPLHLPVRRRGSSPVVPAADAHLRSHASTT